MTCGDEYDVAKIEDELQHLVTAECLGQAFFGEEGYYGLGIAASYAGRAAALQAVSGRGSGLAGAARLAEALVPVSGVALVYPADRARALTGNVLRLRSNGDAACEAMSAFHLLPPGRGGEYLRSLALVHWERSRPAEAVALLERAERLFHEQATGEAPATRWLRVLLHAELGEDEEVLELYRTADAADAADRPWLGARASFAAAFCLAARGEAGDRKAAQAARAEGHELAQEVTDEAERLHLQWLAARAAARRPGRRRKAAEVLAALAEPAAQLWPLGDLTLLALDLQVCRTPGRRGLDLAAVETELRQAAPLAGDFLTVAQAFGRIAVFADSLPVWTMAGLAGRMVRNVFRLRSPTGLRPLPFLVPWPEARQPLAGGA